MGRLKELRKTVNKELRKMPDEEERIKAANHLYGVSLAATLISEKRKQSTELAAMAAMLHDLHAYRSGSYEDHAAKGADLAREILDKLGITSAEENEIICSAIRNHDYKERVDAPMDEVLKDADVLHHCMNDLSKDVKEREKARYASLRREFGIDS